MSYQSILGAHLHIWYLCLHTVITINFIISTDTDDNDTDDNDTDDNEPGKNIIYLIYVFNSSNFASIYYCYHRRKPFFCNCTHLGFPHCDH